jgi:hypothetical protein
MALAGGDSVCACLTGAAKTDCQALLTCMSPFFFSCAVTGAVTACYCSDPTCSGGANGQCAAEFHVVAGTTNPAEVIAQLQDPSTTVASVLAEAKKFGLTAACGMYCGCL